MLYRNLDLKNKMQQKNLKIGDVLLFSGSKNKLNHVAVYIGDSMILNHNFRALSCREPLDFQYQLTLRQVYRYAA